MSITPTDPLAVAQKTFGLIDRLQGMSSADSQVRCVWDVAARQAGPGGVGGRYKRQCRMPALLGVQPPFCRMHAEKAIMGIVRVNNAKDYVSKKKPLARMARNNGAIDPNSIHLSISELEEMIKAKSIPDVCEMPEGGGVYDIGAAVCLATK